jgi:hypothetical protein
MNLICLDGQGKIHSECSEAPLWRVFFNQKVASSIIVAGFCLRTSVWSLSSMEYLFFELSEK